VFIETIHDLNVPPQIRFLHWESGRATMVSEIERYGQIFVPPDPSSKFFHELSLPDQLESCGGPTELFREIISALSVFVRIQPEKLQIAAAIALASWFPDCFEAAPYLWIAGPLGSGKTQLLKLLWCICRRGLLVGDVRAGSIYQLLDTWNPTLLVDELELGSSGANPDLLRLPRSGSVPGTPTVRNGKRFSTYGFKIFSSRQPLGDAALSSRGLIISMSPTACDTPPLDKAAMRKLEKEFQSRLCMLRVKYHSAVKRQYSSPMDLDGLSPRMKQIARALAAPLLGDAAATSDLLGILREQDDEAAIERSLEPEWLVITDLLIACHEGMEKDCPMSELLVGGLATRINQRLSSHGEGGRYSAKRVGLVLKALGVRTTTLGRMGRGLKLTLPLKRKIHEIAGQLGIDRRAIAPLTALEAGYGGVPCPLCEEFGLGKGLRFSAIHEYQPRHRNPSARRLLDYPDENAENGPS
jgi:hypothetical protein